MFIDRPRKYQNESSRAKLRRIGERTQIAVVVENFEFVEMSVPEELCRNCRFVSVDYGVVVSGPDF